MTVLVIGSGGMVGHVLTMYLDRCGHTVTDISHTRKCREQTILMDVLDFDHTKDFLKTHPVDVAVNCAAILNKNCELEPGRSILLNAYFPHFLESFYEGTKTKVIQLSTGGVYKGDHPPYGENAPHDTVTFYGKTKSLGELCNKKDLTIRSDFIGPDLSVEGIGLLNWVMKQQGTVRGFTKAIFNGVTNLELAKFIESILRQDISGTVNLAAAQPISKADFIRLVCQVFQLDGICVEPDERVHDDHSLYSERNDLTYAPKDYTQLLSELRDWINSRPDLYGHYHGGMGNGN